MLAQHRKQQSFLFLMTLFFASLVMAVEEPKYSVLEQSGEFELRYYAPLILAQVQVTGDLDTASSQGFRLIAAYIFGKNQVNDKISMTAPVTMESKSDFASQKIAMTAPVTIEVNNPKNKDIGNNQWVVSFVMPSEYTLATLPMPLDSQVQIREIPAQKKAVITFSGFYNQDKVLEKTKVLEAQIESRHLQAIGEPQFARYNPPWTLPFMRRNEIIIQVRD